MRLSRKAQEQVGTLTHQLSHDIRKTSAKLADDFGREFADDKDVMTAFKHEILKLAGLFLKSGVCKECGGGGEIGLADGEVPCPSCGGSGDPMKPGLWKRLEDPKPEGGG